MARIYGTTEFVKLTGISQPTLSRLKSSGKCTGIIGTDGNTVYSYSDFYNPHIKTRMDKKERLPPIDPSLKAVETSALPPPKPTPKPPTPLFDALTYAKIAELKDGVIVEPLPPFETLGIPGRSIWTISMKNLVTMGTFKTSDLASLISYCEIFDDIAEWRNEIAHYGNTNEDGKVNPLIAAIGTASNRMKTLATVLHMTPDSRKNLEVKDKPEPDAHTAAWGTVL